MKKLLLTFAIGTSFASASSMSATGSGNQKNGYNKGDYLVSLDKSLKIKNYSYKKEGLNWNYIRTHQKDFNKYINIIDKNYKLNLNLSDLCVSYHDCETKHPLKSFFDFKLEKRTLNFMFLVRYMANDHVTLTQFKTGKIAGTRMILPGVLLAARWKRYIQNHAYYKFLTDAMKSDIYKSLLVKYKGKIPGEKIEEMNNFIYAIKERLWYEFNEIVYKLNKKTGFKMLKNSGLVPKNMKYNSKEAHVLLMKLKLLIKKSIPLGGDVTINLKNVPYYENLKLSANWTKLLNNVFNDYRNVVGPKFEYDPKAKTRVYVAYLPFFDKFEDTVISKPAALKLLLNTRKNQFWYNRPYVTNIPFVFYHQKGILLIRNFFAKKLKDFKNELKNININSKTKQDIYNKYRFLVTEYNNYDLTAVISSWGAIIGELGKFRTKWYNKVKPLYNEFVY